MPGGGASAALHAAQGAALLGMVARYTQGPKYAEHEDVITTAIAAALIGAVQPPAQVVQASVRLVQLTEEIAPIANRKRAQ